MRFAIDGVLAKEAPASCGGAKNSQFDIVHLSVKEWHTIPFDIAIRGVCNFIVHIGSWLWRGVGHSLYVTEGNMASNCVIDISHHNGNRLRFDKAKQADVLGVIPRLPRVKPMSIRRLDEIVTLSKGQACFLGHTILGPDRTGFHRPNTSSMSCSRMKTQSWFWILRTIRPAVYDVGEARAFVTHVKTKTGRHPDFYSGHTIKRALAQQPILFLEPAGFGLRSIHPRRWGSLPSGRVDAMAIHRWGERTRSSFRRWHRLMRPKSIQRHPG